MLVYSETLAAATSHQTAHSHVAAPRWGKFCRHIQLRPPANQTLWWRLKRLIHLHQRASSRRCLRRWSPLLLAAAAWSGASSAQRDLTWHGYWWLQQSLPSSPGSSVVSWYQFGTRFENPLFVQLEFCLENNLVWLMEFFKKSNK